MALKHLNVVLIALLTTLFMVAPSFMPLTGGEAADVGKAKGRGPITKDAGTLYGFVTDVSGNPIQGARIEMEPLNSDTLKRITQSQAGGYYTDILLEDSWKVTVSKLGYFAQSANVNIYGGETTRKDFYLDIVPPLDCNLTGKVTNDANGNSLWNATVYVMDAIRGVSFNTTTNIVGNYAVKLYAGDFIVIVSKTNFLNKFKGGIHLDDGEKKVVDISLYPAPAMNARIVGDVTYQLNNGSTGPAPNVTIWVYDPVKSFFLMGPLDTTAHFDVYLYPAKFTVLFQSSAMPFLDAVAVNVTTIANQVVTQNVKLTELPQAKIYSHINITSWAKQTLMQNLTNYGRSSGGSSGPIRAMRFLFDLFFGNGDLYLTTPEVQTYMDLFARSLRSDLGLYDTKDLMTIDGIDFIFNDDLDSYGIDLSGAVFSNKPMYVQIQIGAKENGTIRNDIPVHHVWMNQSYANVDQQETVDMDFPDVFTIKNITGPSTFTFSQTKFTTLHIVCGANPDPDDTNRSGIVNFDLVDRIPPVAKAGPDRGVNEDTDVVFDGSASSDNFGIHYYIWDFGDGAKKNSSSTTAVHNYPNPGKYNVTLTVIDQVHLESTAKFVLTVNDTTLPKVSIVVDKTIVNEDTTVHFLANATDNVAIANISWSLGAVHISNGTTLDRLFDQPGNYIVSVNVTDGAGLKAQASVSMTILDITSPVAVPGKNVTVNESAEVRFNGAGSHDNVGITSYSWSFGDGSANVTGAGTTNPTHTYVRPGNYTVTLNVTDAAGHWDRKSLWVLVNDITPPEASAHASKTTAQVKKKVQFNSTGSKDNVGIVSYRWDFGDGVSADGATAEHSFRKAGSYNVNLTVKDKAGLESKSSVKVVVEEPQNPYLNALCIGSLLAIVFVAGIGAYLVYRRIRLGGYKIEEAFVVYSDGRLIRHISTHRTEGSDKEVIAAMLTAVQDFVKESLKKKEGEFLGKLEFGKKTKILIERGNTIYLAIVLSGHDPESLRNTLAKTVTEVEEKYSKSLKKWDGDVGAFKGLDEMVIELIEK